MNCKKDKNLAQVSTAAVIQWSCSDLRRLVILALIPHVVVEMVCARAVIPEVGDNFGEACDAYTTIKQCGKLICAELSAILSREWR